MKKMNIYMCGVGGQGIGLLAEVMLRVCHYAGYDVKGVDTHGLAQRGGTVVSHLRIGKKVHTPLIPPGTADMIIALERLEAMRGISEMLSSGGKVIYYDVEYQTIDNRLGNIKYPTAEEVKDSADKKNAVVLKVFEVSISDPRMQNVILIKNIIERNWIAGLTKDMAVKALGELMQGSALEKNVKLLNGK